MIEYLVISGAGPHGLTQCGMLQVLMEKQLVMSNIKKIYCTSAGAILSVLLIMSVPIQDIINYLTQRRWDKWIKLDYEFTTSKGILSSSILIDMVLPFLKAYDISSTFTLREFYEKYSTDIHIFTTELKTMTCVDLNHITYPDLPLLTALTMTSCIPLLFPPIAYENNYYIDGGMFNNCPLSTLLNTLDESEYNKVLCIDIIFISSESISLEESSIFQYAGYLISKSYTHLGTYHKNKQYISKCLYFSYDACSIFSPELWSQFLHKETYRESMIETGRELIRQRIDK
jgi:predicted acylesterase/phospholipase RssA